MKSTSNITTKRWLGMSIFFLIISLLLSACGDLTDTSSTASSETGVKITVPTEITMQIGDVSSCGATFENLGLRRVEYSSDRPTIASIDKDGNVTALSGGTATIVIKAGTTTASFKVIVKPGVSELSFAEDEKIIAIGMQTENALTYLPVDISKPTITYTSSDPAVASVDENGGVTGVSDGSAIISAETKTGVTASYTVIVLPDANSILLDKTEIALQLGDTAALGCTVLPDNAYDKTVLFRSLDEAIATVSQDGIITATAIGRTVIEAYIGQTKASCNVTVSEQPTIIEITRITLSPTEKTLYEGDKGFRLSATISPKDATDKSLTFSSSNTSVATVDASGNVTPNKAGQTTITVTAANGVSARCVITVEKVVPTSAPVILDYTFLDTERFIVIGTCEDNATITASNGTQTVTTTADRRYFSISLPRTGVNTNITITATAANKTVSAAISYNVAYKTPPSQQGMWSMLWGYNYQLFLSHYSGGDLGLKDIMRQNSMTDAQLSAFTARVNSKVAALKQINSNAELIYVIIPSPATIYPEQLPDYITPENNPSRIEQIYEALEKSNAKYVDVISLFREHKNDALKLFWKTDTHWTDYGGFLAYTELFDIIKEKFPSAAPRAMSDFTFKEDYYYGGDLAVYLKIAQSTMLEWNALRVPNFTMHSNITSIKRYVSDRQLTYTPGIIDQKQTVYTSRSELPNVVVYRDSYSAQMFDIIADRCNTSVFHGMWDYTLNTSEFRSVKADYVIYILNERNIASILN